MDNCIHQMRINSEIELLEDLLKWCAFNAEISNWRTIDPRRPFHSLRPEWFKRFVLRDALLPWVQSTLGISEFYPDELRANTRPVGLARHLFQRMQRAQNEAGSDSKAIASHNLETSKRVNEPTVFVLGCPRSGTTLLRAMLMGHPHLFAGPELHLGQYKSMRSRERKIVDTKQYWRVMGLCQTLVHMKGWSEKRAFQYVSRLTSKDASIEEVYRLLHRWSPKPILVDKSPALSFELEYLEMLEQRFERARYLWITRHPFPVIRSMINLQICPPNPNFTFEQAQEWWVRHNRNAMSFLSSLPGDRWMRISYESLMLDPGGVLAGVTRFLGLEFDSRMLDVYDGTRIINGIGCINLRKRERVDPSLADKWRSDGVRYQLSAQAIKLSKILNYSVEPKD